MSSLNDVAGKSPAQAVEGTPKAKQKELELSAEFQSMQLENLRLEKELKELEIKEKQANLQDLQERLAERELKRENTRQRAKTNGATLIALDLGQKAYERRCNHRKGGNGAAGVVAGQGDSANYAVIKHTFANGDTWLRCQRCGKTWKPPAISQFATREEYLAKYAEYQAALNFPTTNIPSSSYLFKFSDNGEFYREVTASTTLR